MNRSPKATPAEHAVILHFRLSNDEFGTQEDRNVMLALEDDLIVNIKRDGVGEVDGTETGQGEAVVYLYGPDVRKLW